LATGEHTPGLAADGRDRLAHLLRSRPPHLYDDTHRERNADGPEQVPRMHRLRKGVARLPDASLRAGHEGQQDAGRNPGNQPPGAVKDLFAVHADRPSRSPSRPVGRNISTKTRIPKAMTSRQELRTQVTPQFSTSPSARPPRTAPRMLPIPPRTAAVNALRPGTKPIV